MEGSPLNITSKVYDQKTLYILALAACKRSTYPDLQDNDLAISENENHVFSLKIHGAEMPFSSFFQTTEELSSALLRPFYDKFREDLQILLEIQTILPKLTDAKAVSFNKYLASIGNLCAKIYRRDINKTCIRNLKNNSCLELDALELLEFVQENLEISDNQRQKIIEDFTNLSESIDFCIWSEWGQPRMEKIKEEVETKSFTKEEKANLLTKIYSWKGSKPLSPCKLMMNSPVKRFIASYYVPICFNKMIEILKELNFNEGLKFDSIEERYHFARSFVQIGEICRGVRYVAEAEKGFVRTLNEIRNYMKNPKTHQNIFVKWTDMNHVEKKFNNVLKKISGLRTHIEDCIQEILTKKDRFNLTNLLSQNFEFLQELEKQLEPRGDPVKRELIQSLNNIKGKLEKESLIVKNEFDPTEYNALLSKVSEANQGLFELPNGDLSQIQSYSKKLKCAPPAAVREVLSKIRAIKQQFSQKQTGEDGLEEEVTKLIETYRMQYNKASQKYQGIFPRPGKEDIKIYFSQQIKGPNDAVKGQETEKDKGDFTKLSESFREESKRLKTFLKIPEEQKEDNRDIESKEKIWKIIRNNAALHSIGILGETARYLIENDGKYAFFSQFDLPYLLEDLDKTRHLRNDLMHRILVDKSQDVLHTVYRNILPALPEIERINRFLNQELIYDKSIIYSLFSLGEDCFLLGKDEDGFSYFEQAISAAQKNLPVRKEGEKILDKETEPELELINVVRRIANTYGNVITKLQNQGKEEDKNKINMLQQLKESNLNLYLDLLDKFLSESNNLELRASIYNSLAVTKHSMNNFKEAFNYIQMAVQISQRAKNTPKKRQAIYFLNLATILKDFMSSESKKISDDQWNESFDLVVACFWYAKELFERGLQMDEAEEIEKIEKIWDIKGVEEVQAGTYLQILGKFIQVLYIERRYQYANELRLEFVKKLKTFPEREYGFLMKLEKLVESERETGKEKYFELGELDRYKRERIFKQRKLHDLLFEIFTLEILKKFYQRIGSQNEEIHERLSGALQERDQIQTPQKLRAELEVEILMAETMKYISEKSYSLAIEKCKEAFITMNKPENDKYFDSEDLAFLENWQKVAESNLNVTVSFPQSIKSMILSQYGQEKIKLQAKNKNKNFSSITLEIILKSDQPKDLFEHFLHLEIKRTLNLKCLEIEIGENSSRGYEVFINVEDDDLKILDSIYEESLKI